jgi:membrane-bound lytic murein transglycosylase D
MTQDVSSSAPVAPITQKGVVFVRHNPIVPLVLLAALLVAGGTGEAWAADAGNGVGPEAELPFPDTLRPAVAFWKRVYLEVTTHGGLLHDSRHLGVVYEVVRFEPKDGRRTRERKVEARKKEWRRLLQRLAAGGKPKNAQEEATLILLEVAHGRPPTASDLRIASRRIRFQLGQRDKFRDGLIRSGAYEDAMRAVFRRRSLPEDLAALPHVESSFNLKAYSKYGAAGIWQFIRSTGRRFLTIDYVVDERLDPMASTRAAAALLQENYKSLESWPLAITAYNHGRSGMRRAVRVLGTRDIDVVIEKYKSRTFGFASRNFYPQFLAARDIVRAHESYFGPLTRHEPEPVDEIVLPFYADVAVLKRHTGLAPEVIQYYNPALRPPVFRSNKRIPKGYTLRLPAGTVGPDPDRWFAQIPDSVRYGKQYKSRYHQVRRGDTLSRIAKTYGTTVSSIASINNLPSRHRIYAGQVLELPQKASSRRSVSVVSRAHAKTKPSPDQIRPAPATPPPLPDDSPWRRIDDATVRVDADESLGRFADWLEIPTSRLRKLNRLSRSQDLRMGQSIRLDFSNVSEEIFLQRRIEFHKGVEEDFFGTYRVTGTVDHKLARGERLWDLARRTYGVPIWLIHRYNPGVDLQNPAPVAKLNIPVVEANTGS